MSKLMQVVTYASNELGKLLRFAKNLAFLGREDEQEIPIKVGDLKKIKKAVDKAVEIVEKRERRDR